MKREIKFRGYCDRDSEWRYGYYITDGKIHEINTLLRDDKTLYGSQIDIESLGQYTGLKDKNGVEIYEGDIVRYIETTRIEEVTVKTESVEFISGSFYPLPIDDECEDSWYNRTREDYEIIGKIYENPELLK